MVFQLNTIFYRKKPIKTRDSPLENSLFYEKTFILVSSIFSKNTVLITKIILGLSLFLFVVTVSNTSNLPLVQSIVISLIVAFLPFIFLSLRLKLLRLNVSNEAESIVIEIVNQYKINHFNMLEALTKTIGTINNNNKQSKRILSMLVGRLNEYSSEEELMEILDQFVFSINTQWSQMLANNIYFALSKNLNVLTSLEDIVTELKVARSNFEKEKRSNIEGYMIGQYLIPILYVGSILASIKYFDFTFEKFMDYQLNTTSGIKYFVLIIILSIFSMVTILLQKNKKFDF